MSYWSYRLIVEQTPQGPWYSMRECYFDDNDLIWACSADPDPVTGESPEEIRQMLEWMLKDLGHPPIPLESIPQEGSDNPGSVLDGADLSTATTLEELEQDLKNRWGEDWDKEDEDSK